MDASHDIIDPTISNMDNNPKDVTLIVDNQKISAHKSILASNSQYFDRMFNGNFKERDQDIIKMNITDINYETLNTLIEYFYTSVLTITELNVQDLLMGSSLFGVDNVFEACADYLKDVINVENCIHIKELAGIFNLDNLYSVCQTYMKNYFRYVANTEDFLKVNFDELLLLIKDDDLFVNEEMVYDVVIKWTNYDRAKRLHYSSELIWYVRLPLVLNTYQGSTQTNLLQCGKISFRNEYRKPFRKGILTLSQDQLNSYVDWYDPGLDKWVNCMYKNIQTALIPPTYLCTYFLLNGVQLMAFGGYDNGHSSNLVYQFDLETKKWIVKFKLCYARVKPYITQLEEKIFVVGGSTLTSSAIEYYNIYTKMSKVVGEEDPLEYPLREMIFLFNDTYITRVNELIYIIAPNNHGFFDTICGTWTVIPQLPVKVEGAAICTLNNDIYIIGGRNNENYYKSVWKYCTETEVWIQVTDMKIPRSFFGAAVMNGLIYVFGGKTNDKSYSNTFEVYDPHVNAWAINKSYINKDDVMNDAIVNERETSNTLIDSDQTDNDTIANEQETSNTLIDSDQTDNDTIANEQETLNTLINREKIIITDVVFLEKNYEEYKNVFENPNINVTTSTLVYKFL